MLPDKTVLYKYFEDNFLNVSEERRHMTQERLESRRFTAAIFDLDGTVTDSSLLHWQTFNQVLAKYAIHIEKETWLNLYEGTGARHIFEDVLAKKGLLGKVDITLLRDVRRELFKKLAQNQLLPVKGWPRFYHELRKQGIPSIIATNSDDQNVLFSLQILKIMEEPRVTAKEAGKPKPDPAVYLLAAKRMGFPPEDCVVFEDSVSGVLAAKRAGCYCVAILTTTTREALETTGADLVVRDFTKLLPSMFF